MGYDVFECGICYLKRRGNVRADALVYVCRDCWRAVDTPVSGRLAMEGYVSIFKMRCPQPAHIDVDSDSERACLKLSVCKTCLTTQNWVRGCGGVCCQSDSADDDDIYTYSDNPACRIPEPQEDCSEEEEEETYFDRHISEFC